MTQHPPVQPSKKSRSGISWLGWTVPQGSVYLVSIFLFLLLFFFPARFFSPCSVFFFFCEQFFYHLFFGPPLTPSFFWEAPTYPNPPITLLPTNSPTSLILLTPSPPTSFCFHFHCQSFWPKKSLSSSKLHESKIHKSFKGWELLECPNKRSFNVVAEVGAWS